MMSNFLKSKEFLKVLKLIELIELDPLEGRRVTHAPFNITLLVIEGNDRG